MVGLPNLFPHPDGAVDMPATGLWREIISNVRDRLIAWARNKVVNVDCSAGGTIVLSVNEQFSNGFIRLTGTPAGAFNLELADGDRVLSFENTTAQTATIDTATGATTPIALLTLKTETIQERGIEITSVESIGVEDGALMADGSVSPAALENFADNIIALPKFKDVSLTVTSPSSSAGVLDLDIENGNIFDVTLTEAVTTLNLNNPPNENSSGILLEDGSGELLLEDGSGILLKETTDQFGSVILIARQDGTGGWAITWPSSVKWEGGGSGLLLEDGVGKLLLEDGSGFLLLENSGGFSPSQSSDPNTIDIYSFMTPDGGVTWYGLVLGLDMK